MQDAPFATSGLCDQFYDFARRYPGQTISVDLNGFSCLVVQHPDDADRVLRANYRAYAKNMHWFRQTLGPSRFSEDGAEWEVRRNLTQRHFSDIDADRLHGITLRAVDEYLDSGRDTDGDQSVSDAALRRLAAGISARYFFDLAIEDTGIDLEDLADIIELATHFSFMPSSQAALSYKHNHIKLIALRRRVLSALSKFRKINVKGRLFEDLVAADADRNSTIMLEHELFTIFAAAVESSAAVMGWAMHVLANFPDIQDELYRSLRDHPEHEPLSARKLASNMTLRNFLSEVLRLFPPTPILGRVAVAGDRLGDFNFDEGQRVLVSLIGVHHAPQLRANPWMPDIDTPCNAARFSGLVGAFSIGPRICGGKNFSIIELISTLAVLVLRCRFEPTQHEPVNFYWKAQMLRAGGHRVKIIPRS